MATKEAKVVTHVVVQAAVTHVAAKAVVTVAELVVLTKVDKAVETVAHVNNNPTPTHNIILKHTAFYAPLGASKHK
jgi:hypothetical protein